MNPKIEDKSKRKALKIALREATKKDDPTHALHLEAMEQNDHLSDIKDILSSQKENPDVVQSAQSFFKSLKGEKGDKGDMGDSGYTPVKGKDYIDGKDGKTPQKGVDYLHEEDMQWLRDNISTPEILKQVTPIKGIHYHDGVNGRDGKDGKDGRTIKGPPGEPGKNGRDGKDGIHADPKKVIEAIKSLPEKDKLEFKDIRNSAQFLAQKGGMHGAGVTKLIAGSGITISSASPATNGLGDVTISASGASGTVTSVASADGSITVTNPTTTVDLSVVKSPKLTTGRTISISGDLTYTSPSFDGTGNVTAAGTLATVNSNVGTFGSTTQSSQLTVNGKGLITAVSNVTITPAASSITGAGNLTAASTKISIGTGTGAVLKNATVDLGTVNLDDLADVIIATPLTDQVLKYNGSSWVNGAQSVVNAGAGVEFYYTTTASDISGYKQLTRGPQNVAEQDITVVANNNTVLFFAYSSPSTGLGGTSIDAGTWIFDVFAYASLLTLESHIVLDVYSRTSGGTETLLFSVNSGTLSSTLQLYEIVTVQQAFSINPTDRLIVKVSGETSNTSNTTIHFVFGGTTHYSNVSTPLVTRHNDLAGLQGGTGSGTTGEFYHLTSAEYTGTGSGNFVRATSPTLVTPTLGVASATTINKVTITTPATGSTLTIADGKTLTVNNTLTLAGTDSTTMTFPSTSATIARTDAAQTFTGIQTFSQIVTTPATITVTSNAGTITRSNRINNFTNSSAATMAITLSTSGALDGDLVMVRIYDFSAVAQTIGWTNTENSTVSVPTTSNGSTTLPLTVGFQFNGSTSKWRCIASA